MLNNDLISRAALKNELAPQNDWSWGNGAYVRDIIDAMPPVDAEPVRHGQWVYVGEIHKDNSCCAQWDCSECGSPQTFFGCNPFYRYCPICGAKMDGGAKNVSC